MNTSNRKGGKKRLTARWGVGKVWKVEKGVVGSLLQKKEKGLGTQKSAGK